MIAEIGYGILVVAFFVALYSVGAAIYGERTKSAGLVESARRAMLLLWPLITLAAACSDLPAGHKPLRGLLCL